jgi:predicted phage baseplate assembly protein
VRWHEVTDFYGSGPRDRHYVMDHLSGQIRFGNGVRGRIPAVGPSNLRLGSYRVGGGSTGNRAVGTVTQLKTSVPYVDKVTNLVAATGGAEPETLEAMFERVPRTLRHRDRSVTPEDYEDLAQLATSEVARALAVPLRDLETDPLGRAPSYGVVSVILVPRTSDAKPLPSLGLLDRVRSYLSARTPASASLAVVGPLYLRVDVRTEVAVRTLDDASSVSTAVEAELAAFLHPLTGGLDGKGWDFGRSPHRSDIIARVEGVSGVDHVVFLEVTETEEPRGASETGRFLVHSGKHTITLAFDEN